MPVKKRPIPCDGVPSNPIVPLRMSTEEKTICKQAAAADGYKSLGTWIKHLVRDRVVQLVNQGAIDDPRDSDSSSNSRESGKRNAEI